MRVAIIEASHWHAPLYLDALESADVQVVAVSDGEQAKGRDIAARFGCRFYESYEELLQKETIDFAFAFGRHAEMPRIAEMLIERTPAEGATVGKHLLTKKHEAMLHQLEQQVVRFAAEHKLNAYKTAQLGNTFPLDVAVWGNVRQTLAALNASWKESDARLPHLDAVTLDTMKGLDDLSPIAAAPRLRRLVVAAMPQLTADSFACFHNHPALAELWANVGKARENEAIRRRFPTIAR